MKTKEVVDLSGTEGENIEMDMEMETEGRSTNSNLEGILVEESGDTEDKEDKISIIDVEMTDKEETAKQGRVVTEEREGEGESIKHRHKRGNVTATDKIETPSISPVRRAGSNKWT